MLLHHSTCGSIHVSEENKVWTVIYMAQTKEAVLKVQDALEQAGLAVRVRPVGNGGDDGFFEILVPDTEAQQAHGILIKNGY